MTVTIVKQKSQELSIEQFKEMEEAEKVDTYVQASKELEKAMEKIAPLVKLVGDMGKDLDAIADEQPADEEVVLIGTDFELQYGLKANKVVEVKKSLLRKLWGDQQFFELANVLIGDIRAYCTPPQIEKVLVEKREGKRSKKIVPR